MTPEQILTLLEHGGLAAVLFILLQRVMARLDAVTDKLIEILQKQADIHQQLVIQEQRLNDAHEKRTS